MAREWDPDAGLYYVRNRWYDPEVGRFISEDPIGLAGGINVYAYAANDPVNGRDPYGLCVVFFGATLKQHLDVAKGRSEYCPIKLAPMLVGNGPDEHQSTIGMRSYGNARGGVGGGAFAPPSESAPEPSIARRALQCGGRVLGVEDLIPVGMIASGQPIPGSKQFVTPGAVDGTSLASRGADAIFGDLRSPVRLPTLVGGPGTGRRIAVRGTRSVARFAGRAVPVVGWGLLAIDGVRFGMCMLED